MDRSNEGFLKVRDSLRGHVKTRALGDLLDWPIHEVVGLLVCFWQQVQLDAPGGVLVGLRSPGAVLGALGFKGGRRERIVEALVETGFLDELPDNGGFVVHNWHEHGGIREATRARNAENGAKGGRPPKPKNNPSQTHSEPTQNPDETQTKPELELRGKKRQPQERELTAGAREGEAAGAPAPPMSAAPPSSNAAACDGQFAPLAHAILTAYGGARRAAGLSYSPTPKDRTCAAELAFSWKANPPPEGVDAALEYLRVAAVNLANHPEARNKYGLTGLVNNLPQWHDGGPKESSHDHAPLRPRRLGSASSRPDGTPKVGRVYAD